MQDTDIINDVVNRLYIPNEEQARVALSYMRTDQCQFDFDKIAPVPEHIYMGRLGYKEIALFGDDNWVDWRLKHWGSAYLPYNVALEDDGSLKFVTVNYPVPRIIMLLTCKFGIRDWFYEYASLGDFAAFAGSYESRASVGVSSDIMDAPSKRVFEQTARLAPGEVSCGVGDRGFYWDEIEGIVDFRFGENDEGL